MFFFHIWRQNLSLGVILILALKLQFLLIYLFLLYFVAVYHSHSIIDRLKLPMLNSATMEKILLHMLFKINQDGGSNRLHNYACRLVKKMRRFLAKIYLFTSFRPPFCRSDYIFAESALVNNDIFSQGTPHLFHCVQSLLHIYDFYTYSSFA